MKCTVCGMENKQETIFCVNCGSKLEEPSKRKKPLYKKKWFWVLMSIATVIQLSIAIPLAISDTQTSIQSGTTATKTSEPSTAEYKMNQTVTAEDLMEYTVMSVYDTKNVGTSTTENNFVVVTIRIKNTSFTDQLVDGSNFVYYTDSFTSYSPSGAGIYLDDGYWLPFSLGVGITKTVNVVYEIPSAHKTTDYIGVPGFVFPKEIYLRR